MHGKVSAKAVATIVVFSMLGLSSCAVVQETRWFPLKDVEASHPFLVGDGQLKFKDGDIEIRFGVLSDRNHFVAVGPPVLPIIPTFDRRPVWQMSLWEDIELGLRIFNPGAPVHVDLSQASLTIPTNNQPVELRISEFASAERSSKG